MCCFIWVPCFDNTVVLFAELMRILTGSVYVCEGNSLEEVSLVTQFYKFVITHSLIASDVQKVFRICDGISCNGELLFSVVMKNYIFGLLS